MKAWRRQTLAALTGIFALGSGGCISIDLDWAISRPQKVQHVVLCWMKNPGDTATRDEIIRVSKTFKRIPGVLAVETGTALASERSIVDDSFDVGLIVTCCDQAALQRYLDHPTHREAADTLIKPAARKILVYDIVR